ncbi:hypothetical protein GJAV_G00141210 [Gymnothorax javanicus]|nr:hypothetical protein GJAV_G00141210 [Gymnothorax javanicus]
MKSFYGDKMVEVTVEIFRKIPRNDLIKRLEGCPEQKKCVRTVQEKLKLSLRRKFDCIYEGVAKAGKHAVFRNIYTELYMTEGDCEQINTEHELKQKPIRTVLTKGIAGIGKSVTVQKFILDWAEGKANQDIDFVFFLPFRGLNLIKDECSLLELLQVFHPVMKEVKNIDYEHYKVLCIFDGLEESLNFNTRRRSIVSDVRKTSTVDVLLTNLIRGDLLPSALRWITSRPSAASQIPPELIHRVTEIRGFNDAQKEEYFRKRFEDQTLADRVIAHIRASRSLYIMCHTPVFCWMSATVLEQLLCDDEKGEIPKSLTGMYSHFLLIQATIENRKYQEGHELDSQKLLEAVKEIIVKLSQLAFLGINAVSPVFDEEDLKRCEIDVTKYSVFSAVCTEIFKEEFVLHQKKVYCFVHLSLQEYLAALYVMHAFINKSFRALKPLFGKNLPSNLSLEELHEKVIKKALQSKNGQLDLFLRFLLGLSLDSNQQLLQGLLAQTGSNVESIQKTIQHIKVLNEKDHSPENCINLLHCLSELNDDSLQREVQKYLSSGSSSGESISPAHCSALAYLLLVSGKELDEFDLNAYNTSAEGQQRLVPAVKCCRRAKLSGCNLTENSLQLVGSALQSVSSPLRELDLSNNSLGEPGVELLCSGLRSRKCRLHTLRLGWCDLTEGCCDVLASVLRSPHSELRDLELRDNELQDSGVTALSAGLEDPHCKLQRLGLSGCHVTERGCDSLASALCSNPPT